MIVVSTAKVSILVCISACADSFYLEVDDTPESETENTSHVDVVLALLDNHPENDTTTPLSEEELLGSLN